MTRPLSPWAAIFVLFLSCGGTPESSGPAVDTPEWFWQGAVDSYHAGDYGDSMEYLDKLIEKDDPLARDGAVLRSILLAGMAKGHLEVADAAREAIRKMPGLAQDWQSVLGSESGRGRQAALDLVQSMDRLDQSLADGPVGLNFPFPTGSPSVSPVVSGLESGNPPTKAQLDTGVEYTLRRQVVLTVSRLVGAGESVAGAQSAFADHPTLSAARAHLEFAAILGELAVKLRENLLNDPKLRPVLLDRAEALAKKAVDEGNPEIAGEARELGEKIRNERRVP